MRPPRVPRRRRSRRPRALRLRRLRSASETVRAITPKPRATLLPARERRLLGRRAAHMLPPACGRFKLIELRSATIRQRGPRRLRAPADRRGTLIQAALVIIGAGTIVRASLRRPYRAARTMRVA